MTERRLADPLWDLPHHADASPVLIDPSTGRTWTRRDVLAARDAIMVDLEGPRSLAFLALEPTDADGIVRYLALLAAGHVVHLIAPDLADDHLAALVERYQPRWVFPLGAPLPPLSPAATSPPCGGELECSSIPPHEGPAVSALHPDLALLLSTSGSTGAPKLVRLSSRAVMENARQIVAALSIAADDVAPLMLPLHYAYGLSVLHSHLAAGAAVACVSGSVVSRAFWSTLAEVGATSLAGVPLTWQMLARLDLASLAPPSLRTMTQAGGRLPPRLALHFSRVASELGARFFVMYGQTEATARMACLPPERLASKPDSIGVAVPGGELALVDAPEAAALGIEGAGELVYRGPNVMMGYADGPGDLALGDVLGGELHTGDLATRDADGFFRIVGRRTRFLKIHGHRLSLDRVEALLTQMLAWPVVCTGHDDRLVAVVESSDPLDVARVRREIAGRLGLHVSAIVVRCIEQLPRTRSGKPDLGALAALLEGTP